MHNLPDDDKYVTPQMLDHPEYTQVGYIMELGDSDPHMTTVRANIIYALQQQVHS